MGQILRRAVAAIVMVGLVGCGPSGAPATGTPTQGTPATTAPVATSAATAAPTTAAATTDPFCADLTALKAALDVLTPMRAGAAPQPQILDALAGVGLAAKNLIANGAASKSSHLQPLQIGIDLTQQMVKSSTESEANQAIERALLTGATVLQELGTCP